MKRPHLSIAAAKPSAAAAIALSRPKIGDILAARGLVTQRQLGACLKRQRSMQARLGDMLRAEAGLSEEAILSALETQWSARRLDLGTDPPDGLLARETGLAHCLATRCLPWQRIGAATVIGVVYPDLFLAHRAEFEARFGTVMMALISETDLQEALARTFPREVQARSETYLGAQDSCRSWPGRHFRRAVLAIGGVVALALVALPMLAFAVLMTCALGALVLLTALKAAACYTALMPARRRAPGLAEVVPLHPSASMQRPVVSLLVPLFREERIAGQLLSRLARLKYPRALLDICLVVEADDRVTRRSLAGMVLPPNARVIVVPHGSVRTKPRAMNYALDHCRGSIVGVYDAEDAPDPDQIARVVTRFAACPPEVACLQGRLSFYNARDNWLSRCFTIDYAIWFGMVLPGIARLGMPVPLGGTTLFFRRDVLEQLGRWDAFNVTEDADLGIRLARRGYRTELIDTTTLEEANCRLWPWVRQRSRWLKGYAMTYITHMRDPARLWADLGPVGFAGFQILFMATLLQALTAPLLWSWWLVAFGLPHPLTGPVGMGGLVTITGLLILSEAVNLTLAALALRRAGRRWMLPWVLTLNLYYMLTTIAAFKALAEMLYRPFFWDKTEHGVCPAALEDALPAADMLTPPRRPLPDPAHRAAAV